MNPKIFLLSAILIMIVSACAAPVKKEEAVVFFPPPPELPRIQYLTSFTSAQDIETPGAFQKFVEGEKENRRLDKPYGVGIYDGKIYVCDTNTSLTVLDLKNRTYGFLKGAKGPGKLIQPLNISIEADGTKYVADPARGQVVVYDRNDEYVMAYGKPAAWRPVDAVPFEEMLYVADIKNRAIRVFDKKSGEEVKVLGNSGAAEERLGLPTNLAFDSDGNLFVSDAGRFQVLKFDRDGHFLSVIGKLGTNIGHFARPKGIAIDKTKQLFAVDAAFNNVQIFNKDGRLLLFFGGIGPNPGNLVLPAGIAIDYDNVEYFRKYAQPDFDIEYLILVTSQFGNRMVSVLGAGKERGKQYPTEEEVLKRIDEMKQKELEKLDPEKKAVNGQDRKDSDQTGGETTNQAEIPEKK